MASGAANSPPRARAASPEPESSMQHHQFIQLQLARTRRRVKLVDLGGVLMGLIGGILLYILGVVLIDHWLIDLNSWQRFAALAILALGTGYYVAKFVAPLLVRRINPTFAARAIEQSDPSLKNSLINLLMFRRDRSPTSRLVYRALQQRAAQDLHTVNIDLAVDRTRLIHIGYTVVALMVIFVAYTVFSPKDVFQTVRRITIPWADIARPSRVTISDVQPGDASVILGEAMNVSANIHGVRQDDTVTLFYSTEDQQIVNRPIPMTPAQTDHLYECTLPGDKRGIQQNLRYHIEAGDARSAEYRLSVRYIPTIVVQRIQYDYPPYTQRDQRVVEGQGEVYAIEGTRVTIHAQANYPIKNATLEFHPTDPAAGLHEHTMKISPDSKDQASYTFRLLCGDDRQSPEHASYRLSFETDDNRESDWSVEHKISVSPDLPPDIEILTPKKREMELPVDRVQKIEIRALDPDFGLTKVVLQAVAGGKNLVDETLMTDEQGRTGQEILDYSFNPRKLDLVPGDKVTYLAFAEDNRMSPTDDVSPSPNSARTDSYVIIIGPADPANPGSSGDQANDAPQNSTPETASGGAEQQPTPATPQAPNNQPPNNQSPDDNEGADSQPSDPAEKNNQGDASQQKTPPEKSGSQSDSANPEQSESSSQGSQGESGDQQSGQTQSAQQGQETQGSQSGSGGQQQESGQSGDSASQMQSGSQGSGSESSPQGNSQQSGADGNKTGSNAGQQPQMSQDSPGGSGDSQSNDQSTGGGSSQNQSAEGQQGGREEPLHPGEAFERMMEYLARKENSAAEGQSSEQPSADPNGNRPEQQTAADQNSGETAGDQSRQDGSAGKESPSPQPGAGSPSEMIDSATPSATQPDAAGDPDGAAGDSSDHPGKPAENDAGQGDNGDPQQGPGEKQLPVKSPKSVEGAEKTTNTDSEPTEKQSGHGDEGEAGSGRPANDPSGSPSAQKANRDRDKSNQDPNREATDDDAAQGTSKSKHQSDSQSDDGGSKSGGGQHGGGQPANQPGRDSPGSNMSSDQGNTGSPESGQGETADRGGDKQQSPHATGESGQKPGPGSQSAAAPDGQQPAPEGASPTSPQSTAETDNNQQRQPSPNQQSPEKDATTSGGSGPPQGGGLPGDSTSTATSQPKEIPDGDEANLEYARKATDLVLQRLKDQQDKPDPELLKSLGWTKDELQQFIASWEALKRAAREESGESHAELDDALRSLGLRPTTPVRQQSQGANDQMRGMHDSGDRSRPPAEFLEQFNAYKKGAARGPSDGGQ